MKATTLLLSRQQRIQALVRAATRSDEHALALLEAVATQIAVEEGILYPVAERELAVDTSVHRGGHVRVRLALFRLATAPKAAFEKYLAHLDQVLRDHALAESAIVRALEDRMTDAGLVRLGHEMIEFQRAS
jgi:hypothetical protein